MKLEQLIRQQVDMYKEMADLNELLKALQDAEDVPTYKKPVRATNTDEPVKG